MEVHVRYNKAIKENKAKKMLINQIKKGISVKKMISKKKKMILAAMLAGVMSLGVVGGNVSYAAT